MKRPAAEPRATVVDLFHATAVHEQAAIIKLTADAQAAGAQLHLLVDARNGRLDDQRIRGSVPGWRLF